MNITSPAIEYWQSELTSKNNATREIYLHSFTKFLEATNKTADELLTQRQQDQINPNPKIQRRIESELNHFIAAKKGEGFAPATLQVYFASVRSFFEIHYFPLRIRKGDYPTGDSIGVRIATKEAILKALEQKTRRPAPITNAVILFLKDSGLRVSDAQLLNYGHVAKHLENNAKFIPITMVTKKVRLTAKTFIGEEAIEALKTYLTTRQHGTRRIPPEKLTDDSPLFRTWNSKTVQRIPRTTLSNIVRNAFKRIHEPAISAHSLRKYLQTNLEAGNVNVNWIDQMLGHKLINSRDAYSKPTDEQLKEAYTKAYKFLRVYPDPTTPEPQPTQNTPPQTNQPTQDEYIVKTAKTINEVTQLLQQGFTHIDTIDGTRLYSRRK